MNRAFFHGRLTKDVDLRYTPSGVPVATGTIAVNRRFKREGQPEADFHNFVVWQKAAETLANNIGKGCRINLMGRMETRNYDGQDGKRVYVTELIVEEMDFIDYKDNGQGAQNGQNNGVNNSNSQSQGQRQNNGTGGRNSGYKRMDEDPFAGNGQIDIMDDDLPF